MTWRRWMTGVFFVLSALFSATAFGQGAEDDLSSNRMSLDAPWGISYFGATSAAATQFERGGNAVDVYNYLSFSRSVGRDQRVSVRPSWNMNSAGTNSYGDELKSGINLNDVQLNYSNYDLGEIMDVPVGGALKVYFPTSKYSQNSRMIVRTAADLFFEFYDFRRWTVSYAFKPGYTWNNETAYVDQYMARWPDGAYKSNPIKGTKSWTLDQYLNVDWRYNSRYRVGGSVGFNEDWYNASIRENIAATHKTYFLSRLSAEWRPRRGYSFSASYSTSTRAGGGKFSYGRPEDATLGLSTSIYLN